MSDDAKASHLAALPVARILRQCEVCGADCDTDKNVCWMCRSRLNKMDPYAAMPVPQVGSSAPRASSPYDMIFTLLLAACMIVATLLAIGVAAISPGLLLAYGVLFGPAFLITGTRALTQLGTTGDFKPRSLFVTLMASFAITVGAIGILAIAALALLAAMCANAIVKS